MKLSVNIISQQLPFARKQLWDTQADNCLLEDVWFLHDGLEHFEPQHLYIGSFAQLPPPDSIPGGCSFLCYGPCALAPEQTLPFNLISVQEPIDGFTLFNLVQRIFGDYRRWQEQLEAAVQSEAPLQTFIDISTPVIGWPLAIIDLAQGTLAISDFNESDDIIWSEQQRGYIRTELCAMDSIQNEDIESQRGPVQMYSSVSGRMLLAQAVRVRNHTVCFVSAHRPTAGTEHFPRATEQLLSCLTQAISNRLGSSEFYQYSRGFVLDCLLADLIDGKIEDADTIRDRLEFAQWEGFTDSRIFVLELQDPKESRHGLQCMLEQAESLLQNAKALYYHGRIVLLQRSDAVPESRFLNWIAGRRVLCGVSNAFTDYTHMTDYYLQACKAVYFGHVLHPEQNVYLYQDYIQQMIYETLSKTADLRQFLHPDMYKLLRHNKTKDHIYDTVTSYIQNDFNLINTSKAMFIHKNTLSYRLHQIEELTGLSLNDARTRAMLTQAVGILSYMIQFQNYDIRSDTYAEAPKAAQADPNAAEG